MTTRILAPPDYKTAPEPSGVVANTSARDLRTTTAKRMPSSNGPTSDGFLSARRVIAAILRAGTSLLDLHTLLVAIAGECRASVMAALRTEFQYSTIERRARVLKGLRCRVCHEAIHDDTEMCPQQWAGQCDICGPVLLDYFRNGLADDCDPRDGHVISRQHKATLDEWRRSRSAVLRPEPIARGKPATG